uniref:Uncharacterized protein n=1 Tax=Parascaris univalens TaxID=6257 RepID=A0A915C311_PARUN
MYAFTFQTDRITAKERRLRLTPAKTLSLVLFTGQALVIITQAMSSSSPQKSPFGSIFPFIPITSLN